jgi:hypothetical protein
MIVGGVSFSMPPFQLRPRSPLSQFKSILPLCSRLTLSRPARPESRREPRRVRSGAQERSPSPSFSTISALYTKTPGCHQERFFQPFNFELFNLFLRNSFIRNTYSRSTCFSRNQPKLSVRKSFRIHTCRESICKFFRIRTYKKVGGGGDSGPGPKLSREGRSRAAPLR